jgi:hypothetical protein
MSVIFHITFRACFDCRDAIKSLRALLKTALRRDRLRCLSAVEEKTDDQ